MEFLINANVSYVLLVLGFLIAILALFSPGTGILEVAALTTLVLAGYGIANLPINEWAFLIMALGIVPFVVAVWLRTNRKTLLMIAGIAAFLVGSALLYSGKGWVPAVHPILIALLTLFTIGFTWIMAAKTLEAVETRPNFDLNRLVGMTGQASSDIRWQGTVYVNGEEWSATSKAFIPAGSAVRVISREGLSLVVEQEKA